MIYSFFIIELINTLIDFGTLDQLHRFFFQVFIKSHVENSIPYGN